MQRLDKTDILATNYKEWLDTFAEDKNHPGYNSSQGKFYYDIIANLIWIQKGLCDYTEFCIQDHNKCGAGHWRDGSFMQFTFAGELDHYNPLLKEKKGWLWDNLFLIDADVNSKKVKGSLIPKGILKPDKVDFDPLYFIEYDVTNHIFLPSKVRPVIEQNDIFHDIKTLGLNWQPTVERRAKYLNEKIQDVKFGKTTFEESYSKLYQFFTAFLLCKDYMLT